MRSLIIALACLLPSIAFAQPGNRISLACFDFDRAMVAAEKKGFLPIGRGVDGDGDLWTLWRNPVGEFVLTVMLSSDNSVCMPPVGENWEMLPHGSGT